MTRVGAFLRLAVNFLRDLGLSGWSTARIILDRQPPEPGFARLAIPGLSPGAASLLAALSTLTPGTTAVDVDLEAGELTLHLLDRRQAGAVLAGIERDFVVPLRILTGGQR